MLATAAWTGATTILDILGGTLGGTYTGSDFSLSTGTEGKFLTVSLSGMCGAVYGLFWSYYENSLRKNKKRCVFAGGTVPPGYNLVGNIDIDPASPDLGSCDPGSIGLYNVIISDPDGLALENCGGFDDSCFVREKKRK